MRSVGNEEYIPDHLEKALSCSNIYDRDQYSFLMLLFIEKFRDGLEVGNGM